MDVLVTRFCNMVLPVRHAKFYEGQGQGNLVEKTNQLCLVCCCKVKNIGKDKQQLLSVTGKGLYLPLSPFLQQDSKSLKKHKRLLLFLIYDTKQIKSVHRVHAN